MPQSTETDKENLNPSMGQVVCSWPVVGTLVFFILSGAIAFMTSAHPWLADAFFMAGEILFVLKFLTWKESRTLMASAVVVILSLFLTSGAIWGTRKLNPPRSVTDQNKPAPPPLFAVDIEHRIFTTPGAVTSFWFGSFGLAGCSITPTSTAIFLRITNQQPQKEMITAYSIEGLEKIPVTRGRMFIILPNGKITGAFVPHEVDWGAPAGMGALVTFPADDADASKAIPVTGDFLDYKIGEGHYLDSDESVRGWVFFEYHKGRIAVPGHLTIQITDQFQRTFRELVPDHLGNPQGDILPRRIVEGPLEDLSRCTVFRN